MVRLIVLRVKRNHWKPTQVLFFRWCTTQGWATPFVLTLRPTLTLWGRSCANVSNMRVPKWLWKKTRSSKFTRWLLSLDHGLEIESQCTRPVTMETGLHSRHGKTLVLRNMKWLITGQQVTEPLLRRSVLEALDFNSANILAAAEDQKGGPFDLSKLEMGLNTVA